MKAHIKDVSPVMAEKREEDVSNLLQKTEEEDKNPESVVATLEKPSEEKDSKDRPTQK